MKIKPLEEVWKYIEKHRLSNDDGETERCPSCEKSMQVYGDGSEMHKVKMCTNEDCGYVIWP